MAYDDGEVTKAPPAAGILQIAPVTNKSTHVQGGTIIGGKPANAFAGRINFRQRVARGLKRRP